MTYQDENESRAIRVGRFARQSIRIDNARLAFDSLRKPAASPALGAKYSATVKVMPDYEEVYQGFAEEIRRTTAKARKVQERHARKRRAEAGWWNFFANRRHFHPHDRNIARELRMLSWRH